MKTSDGGATWVKKFELNYQHIYSLSFSDPLNGWAVGWGGSIVKTTDGGENWVNHPRPDGSYLFACFFLSTNRNPPVVLMDDTKNKHWGSDLTWTCHRIYSNHD